MADAGQNGLAVQARPSASADGPMQRIAAYGTSAWQALLAMPAGRRTTLLGSLLLLGAVSAGFAWYAGRPDWRPLFSGLDARDVQQVAQELTAAKIPFEMTPDGTGVQVPAEQLDKARMEVAAKGMPQSGRLGFEIFDKPNWAGSEFDEKVNYQRALEGELEHTIGTLGVVRSARVHLVLPAPALFAAETSLAKASVVLKLNHQGLAQPQAESIRNLVAGAVENLSPEQVTLVDADGRVNLQAHSADAAQAEQQQRLEEKLVAMLEPLAGRENVRATVNVSYAQGTEERSDEIYDPSQTVTLSMQKSSQSSNPAARASGVPGTASNTPAASAAGSVTAAVAALPVFPAGAPSAQSVMQENGVYGVTKHVQRSQQGPGRVLRVVAAVVVNDRASSEGTGKALHTIWKPRSTDEMKHLESLAQAAVGFDSARGDSVVVENVGFTSNVPEVSPAGFAQVQQQAEALLKTQPGLLRTAALGLVGVLLVMFCLRPVARQVSATLAEPRLLTAGSSTTVSPALRETHVQALAEPVASAKAMPVTRPSVGVLEHVSQHIRREPQQSTRLLEAWIGSINEGE